MLLRHKKNRRLSGCFFLFLIFLTEKKKKKKSIRTTRNQPPFCLSGHHAYKISSPWREPVPVLEYVPLDCLVHASKLIFAMKGGHPSLVAERYTSIHPFIQRMCDISTLQVQDSAPQRTSYIPRLDRPDYQFSKRKEKSRMQFYLYILLTHTAQNTPPPKVGKQKKKVDRPRSKIIIITKQNEPSPALPKNPGHRSRAARPMGS